LMPQTKKPYNPDAKLDADVIDEDIDKEDD
jgi:hypothetical protein